MARPRSRRGQSLVEFALILPILLLLLVGLINVAVLVQSQIILTHAAWEGARTGATLNIESGEGDAEIVGAVLRASIGIQRPDRIGILIDPAEEARGVIPWPGPRGLPLTVSLEYPLTILLPLAVELRLRAQAASRIEYSNPP